MSSSKKPDPKKFTPPASPTASYYDLSDGEDSEEEYSTITHMSTGRGVKLLYSKSKVCCLALVALPGDEAPIL